MVKEKRKPDMIIIRCAELTANYNLGNGFYIPQIGTLNASGKLTEYNDAVAANKTPVASGAERIVGPGEMSPPNPDDDMQDFPDIATREIHRGVGNFNGSGQMMVPLEDNPRLKQLGTPFHVVKEYYSRVTLENPILYDLILLWGVDYQHLGVTTATTMVQLYAFTRGSAQPQYGEGKMQIDYHYRDIREWEEYAFNAELYGDGAGAVKSITASTPTNPDAQLKLESRLKLTIENATVWGDIVIKGLDYEGRYLEETVTFSSNTTKYTTELFSRIYDDSDGDPEKGIQPGSGWVDADLLLEADELHYSLT